MSSVGYIDVMQSSSILFRLVAVSGCLLAGCKSKPADTNQKVAVTTTGSAAPVAPPVGSGAAPAAPDKLVEPHADLRCDTPCRFLSDTAIDAVADAYKKSCNKEWPASNANACEQFDFQRNCIYADKGYSFQNPKWKDIFAKQGWYAARADFKETDLSAVARNNITALKRNAMACRSNEIPEIPTKFSANKVSKADLATVVKWFADRRGGKVVLPSMVMADGKIIEEADFKKDWSDQKHLFQLHAWTPITYSDNIEPNFASDVNAVKRIDVPTGAPAPDCRAKLGPNDDSESCEGFETITFYLDKKGAIVGIETFAAACPLVYLQGASGALTYQGEVLRNVVGASRETTQTLTFSAMGDGAVCESTIVVQVVEAKDETTFLDGVSLMLDGTEVAPRECSTPTEHAYCNDDQRYHTLRQDQFVTLHFDVPAGSTCKHVALRANGFYIPNLMLR